MDFKEDISRYKSQVDQELQIFLEDEIKTASRLSPYVRLMAEHIAEFSMRGGKRIRPLLMIKCYHLLGGKEEREITRASLAIELLQSYLLIHDDLMDRDAVRRGKPSSWHYFTGYHKQHFSSPDPEWFGNSMAVLAGDICSALSLKAIAHTAFPEPVKERAMHKLSEMNLLTGYGQLLDMLYEQKGQVSQEEVLRMYELKTSHYTISGPLELGGIFAGANPEIIKTLSLFGIPAGKAFQIHDDLLGIYADEQKLGKPVGSDLTEGKRTLLMAHVYEAPDSPERNRILSFLGKPGITQAELEEVRELMKSMGALQKAEEKRAQFVEEAKKAASSPLFSTELRQTLEQFTDYLVCREY